MQALTDYVLIEPTEEAKPKSGIIIPDQLKEQPLYGIVHSVGKDCAELKEDQKVLLPRYSEQIELLGKKYIICHEKDISCVIN